MRCANKGADEVRISTTIKGAYPGLHLKKVAVYDCSSNSVLWEGRYTDTCVIKIQNPTEIYVHYHGLAKHVTKGLQKVVEPGKRYAATVHKGVVFAQYTLVEVDVIDSA